MIGVTFILSGIRTKLSFLRIVFLIFIVATLLLQTCSCALVAAGFYINRNYIAHSLCEQRNVLNNCCQGKCHLRKSMNEEESKDHTASPNGSKEQNELQYVDNHSKTIIIPPQFYGHILNISVILPPSLPSTAIFHPPKLAS